VLNHPRLARNTSPLPALAQLSLRMCVHRPMCATMSADARRKSADSTELEAGATSLLLARTEAGEAAKQIDVNSVHAQTLLCSTVGQRAHCLALLRLCELHCLTSRHVEYCRCVCSVVCARMRTRGATTATANRALSNQVEREQTNTSNARTYEWNSICILK
jgi:hypothetical protein